MNSVWLWKRTPCLRWGRSPANILRPEERICLPCDSCPSEMVWYQKVLFWVTRSVIICYCSIQVWNRGRKRQGSERYQWRLITVKDYRTQLSEEGSGNMTVKERKHRYIHCLDISWVSKMCLCVMLRESLLNLILWPLLTGLNSRLHVAAKMSYNPMWSGATKDGGGEVVSPGTQFPCHHSSPNVNRCPGPPWKALNSDPGATEKPIWPDALTLESNLYQLPGRKHPLQRSWGRRLEDTWKRLLKCRDPGKKRCQSWKENLYIWGRADFPTLYARTRQEQCSETLN